MKMTCGRLQAGLLWSSWRSSVGSMSHPMLLLPEVAQESESRAEGVFVAVLYPQANLRMRGARGCLVVTCARMAVEDGVHNTADPPT